MGWKRYAECKRIGGDEMSLMLVLMAFALGVLVGFVITCVVVASEINEIGNAEPKE